MNMKSKLLFSPNTEEDNSRDFGYGDDDDDDDYRETLERARKINQRKHQEDGVSSASPPQSLITRLANIFNLTKEEDEKEHNSEEKSQLEEKKQIVFTDMEEFLHVHRLDPDDDVFMVEEEKEHVAVGPTQEPKYEVSVPVPVPVPDENVLSTIHQEVAIGKGLSGAISLLKQRGELKEEETMDKKKKKSKLNDYGDEKEIVIIRRDENGKDLTPHEAFKVFSHRFHGKAPGKKKQEKRMKQEEMKMKMKMKNNAEDTPSSSSLSGVERMREAQAQLKSPYLVLSGNVKPGQIRDHRSGYGLLYGQTAQAPDLNMNLI